jgi:hypothetical protein
VELQSSNLCSFPSTKQHEAVNSDTNEVRELRAELERMRRMAALSLQATQRVALVLVEFVGPGEVKQRLLEQSTGIEQLLQNLTGTSASL